MNIAPIYNSVEEIRDLISRNVIADYIYKYPPRQTYNEITPENALKLAFKSLEMLDDVNLYFHFPFCEQICSFCNLYTYKANDVELFNRYIEILKKEFMHYFPYLLGKNVRTIYLGGGTPSLIPAKIIGDLLLFIRESMGFDIFAIPEVGLEVAADTVELGKFSEYRDIGINRVNLGLQSANDLEIKSMGKIHGLKKNIDALNILKKIGFKNVCVDLIYGLAGQTEKSWRDSLDIVKEFEPETICAYSLTLRPHTRFNSRGYRQLNGQSQYSKYDYVCEALMNAGYEQETHVRWVKKPNGGYFQKRNHWAMENVLGFGAGARSYLWEIDTRNGYSIKHRKRLYQDYVERITTRGYGIVDGFIMTNDERMRKAVILGLIKLNKHWFKTLFNVLPEDIFPVQFEILKNAKLIEIDPEYISLTKNGMRHRDVIVQVFFSNATRMAALGFDYDE
jgi:oxygen-independent coproporphyrinogen III oxidase